MGTEPAIAGSTGANLAVETTALAVLALIQDGSHRGELDRALAWLHAQRHGGRWGATQATVLALEAITRYDAAFPPQATLGEVRVRIDGRDVGRLAYDRARAKSAPSLDLSPYLSAGRHSIALAHQGGVPVPYAIDVTWRTETPASSTDAPVEIHTGLVREGLPMGETTRLSASVRNLKAEGQGMAIARIGLPGGLTVEPWQLEALVKRGEVDFVETRPREVIAYWRQLAPHEEKLVELDLVASVPGEYTAPASSAYLYYGDERKSWAAPVRAVIGAPNR